jgi:nucleoside 2-deoxyribosyltransferase
MNVYLASRYSRHEELQSYRDELEKIGFTVTSRWINGDHQINDQGLSDEAKASERLRFAMEDWEDLRAADICISFTEIPRSSNSRGGRHVEFGAALAYGKTCIVVGPRENVFHCLPHIVWFAAWADALAFLTSLEASQC